MMRASSSIGLAAITLAIGTLSARADSCGTIISGASTAGYQGKYGGYDPNGNCHARNVSESECRNKTGDLFVYWSRDSGKNFTRCEFTVPHSSSATPEINTREPAEEHRPPPRSDAMDSLQKWKHEACRDADQEMKEARARYLESDAPDPTELLGNYEAGVLSIHLVCYDDTGTAAAFHLDRYSKIAHCSARYDNFVSESSLSHWTALKLNFWVTTLARDCKNHVSKGLLALAANAYKEAHEEALKNEHLEYLLDSVAEMQGPISTSCVILEEPSKISEYCEGINGPPMFRTDMKTDPKQCGGILTAHYKNPHTGKMETVAVGRKATPVFTCGSGVKTIARVVR